MPEISTGWPAKKLSPGAPGVVTIIKPQAGCQSVLRRSAVTCTCATERSVCRSSRTVMRKCGVSIKVPRTVTMALVSPSNARKSFGETTAMRPARLVQPTSASSGQINQDLNFSRTRTRLRAASVFALLRRDKSARQARTRTRNEAAKSAMSGG